jgi:phage terminase large subunit-like protein
VSESLLQHVVRRYGADALTDVMTVEQLNALRYEWQAIARPEQLLPDDKRVCLLLAGRRYGKTRTAAEWVRSRVERELARNIILVAPTHNDMLTDMLYGPSGIVTISPPWNKPHFKTTDNTLNWANGARAICLTAEEPERTRGKEVDTVWCDEIAAWRYPETWELLQFCAGSQPMRFVVTTTPKPTDLVKHLLKTSDFIIRGNTFDNSANLSAEALQELKRKYDGTRIGRQELYAELLEDVEGALWSHGTIDKARVSSCPVELRRIVVAVDPSGSAKRTADEAGIVVAGIGHCSCLGRSDTHAFVLEDLTDRYSPRDMGEKAIGAYRKYKCDRLVAEDNFGGKIIEDLVRLIDPKVAYRAVHATRGKLVRAEPVAALYEQGRVHHVGMFRELEDEMCGYAPLVSTESPGRLDAMVWALTDLMLGEGRATIPDLGPMPTRRL